MNLIRGYPGMTQTKIESEADRHIESMRLLGYSIMENVISVQEANGLGEKLAKLMRDQEKEYGEDRLRELNEFEAHRGLLEADDSFANLVINQRVLEVVDKVIGKSAILNLQNASTAYPGSKHWQSAYHRDFAKDIISNKPVSMNAFWCISDFSPENGATWIVPCSHRDESLPSDDFIKRNEKQMVAKAGSVILWDSLLLHKAGHNTQDQPRYGINHMYTRPYLKQQLDFPVYLKGKYNTESRLGQLLGFWTIPPKSVKEYRVDSDKRTYRSNQG